MFGFTICVLVAVAATGVSWDIQLAPDSEPGPRLVVAGRVRQAPGSPPLTGVSVYAYHADGKGLYARPGEEKKGPRLAGTLRTGADGRYRIRTVLPGSYGGPPHVHFEVWGSRLPRRAFVLNLALPFHQAAAENADSGSAIDRAIRGRERTMTMGNRLTRDANGVLHVKYDIFLRDGFFVPAPKQVP